VLFLTESMEIAGAEQLVLALLRRLDRRRFEPVVGCLAERGPLAPDVESLGIEVVALGKRPGFDLRVLARLVRLMRERRIDILHSHVWPADVWGRVAAKVARVPILITTQHSVAVWKRSRHFLVDRLLSRFSATIVCVSRAVLDFYRDDARLAPHRLRLIYNGIDPAPFVQASDRDATRAKLEATPEQPVLLVVGRLIPEKTQVLFLEALALVRRDHPTAIGWIAGDGPLRAELEERVRSLELDGTRLLGARRDVAELLHAADAFVLPTGVREGLSLSLLEAMAAGCTAVATDVGGNRETIDDGRTGHLVPKQDVGALAAAMGRVLSDRERARRMSEAARAEMLDRFTLDRMVHDYEELYLGHARRCRLT